jgi:hypothetical protein
MHLPSADSAPSGSLHLSAADSEHKASKPMGMFILFVSKFRLQNLSASVQSPELLGSFSPNILASVFCGKTN